MEPEPSIEQTPPDGRTSGKSTEYRPLPTEAELAANVGLYRIAYDESISAINDQVGELDGIRQRLVSFLAFVGSATAFLAGSSLTATADGHRTVWFYIVALAATALLLATIGTTVRILSPGFAKLAHAASATDIVAGYIEVDIATNEGFLLRNLALHNDEDVEDNRKILRKVRARYLWAITMGAVELVLLISLVWFFT